MNDDTSNSKLYLHHTFEGTKTKVMKWKEYNQLKKQREYLFMSTITMRLL